MACHICIYWKPETGCKHYLPDAETILKANGWSVYKPGIHTRQKKYIVCKGPEQHKFDSLSKAAFILIHSKK